LSTRVFVAGILAVVAVAGCSDTPRLAAWSLKPVSACKGLLEAQCAKKPECAWSAEQDKCKKKESESKAENEAGESKGDGDWTQQGDSGWGSDGESRH
jgi:hypothetical protein